MKTTILLFFLALASCSKDSAKQDPVAQLPPETQTGAYTFACIINNQVFYPRDGSGNLGVGSGARGLIFWGDPSGDRNFNEIDCGNFKDGKPASRMIIHLHNLATINAGEYVWLDSNFQKSIDGLQQNYLYVNVYDAASNSYKYYGSYKNSGKTTITQYGNIVSGTFSGKVRLRNGTEEIDIINGRFYINSSTLSNK